MIDGERHAEGAGRGEHDRGRRQPPHLELAESQRMPPFARPQSRHRPRPCRHLAQRWAGIVGVGVAGAAEREERAPGAHGRPDEDPVAGRTASPRESDTGPPRGSRRGGDRSAGPDRAGCWVVHRPVERIPPPHPDIGNRGAGCTTASPGRTAPSRSVVAGRDRSALPRARPAHRNRSAAASFPASPRLPSQN